MKRHAIIGHFGRRDDPEIAVIDGETATRLELVSWEKHLDHGIGRALKDLAKISIFPTELGLDLLVLAAHVHAADTRISRTTESQDNWTREMRLVVPVSDPVRWTASTELLKRMLDFLTGDRWSFIFRPRPRGFATLVPNRPMTLVRPPYDSLSLFSGGLDSLVGAIDTLEAGGIPLLISHASEGATSDAQQTCFTHLKKHYRKTPFDRLRVWMNFPKTLIRGVGAESTTRGRSFLFFSIGVMAGTGFDGRFTLRAPENGFIALNVPMDPLRLGALSTHTMHPYYLARWNELLDRLEIPGRIENPYWDKTKSEMVAACSNSKILRHLISNSLSCSSPSKGRWLGHGIEHCGYCLPCLVRRAALDKWLGRGADPTDYTLRDLNARILDTRQAEGQQVRSLQFAIKRLRARPELAKLLIHKPGPLSDVSEEDRGKLARVYQRGLNEVGALIRGVRARPS